MEEWMCADCGHTFLDIASNPVRCPVCGSKSIELATPDGAKDYDLGAEEGEWE